MREQEELTWLVSLYEPGRIFYEVFTSGCQLHIFICYQFLIMSNKRSSVLSRLEDHNTGPYRVQNERFVNDSQRQSKKTEKSNGSPIDENGSVSHHSKRSKEKSPSKKRSRSCSRSSSRKRSHSQSPRPGPSC